MLSVMLVFRVVLCFCEGFLSVSDARVDAGEKSPSVSVKVTSILPSSQVVVLVSL